MIKIHWMSKKLDFFRTALTKIHYTKLIIFEHILAIVFLKKHPWKQKVVWVRKEKNVVKSQRVLYQKSQKLLNSWLVCDTQNFKKGILTACL